jgi:D-hexose-6-phosphate mutarotase
MNPSLPKGVTLVAGKCGLPMIAIDTPIASAEVYLHGAHVTQFTPKGKNPLLFVSRESYFADDKPIRGGVPLIFPWFGPNAVNPALPAHGFARTRKWELAEAQTEADGSIRVRLTLGPDENSRKMWPHEFSLAFAVVVGKQLRMELHVRNTGSAPFTFEEALHTYLAVADVRKVSIDGLANREYLDKTDGGARKTQRESPFGIVGETDRVYLNTPDTVIVNDPAGSQLNGPRLIAVSKKNSGATVVWNPWIAKSIALKDFGDDEWPQMLCIETANAASNTVTLDAGKTHVMSAEIGLM